MEHRKPDRVPAAFEATDSVSGEAAEALLVLQIRPMLEKKPWLRVINGRSPGRNIRPG